MLLDGLRKGEPLGCDPQKGTGTDVHGRSQSPFASAYVVRCVCDSAPGTSGGKTVVDHIRLFPRLKGLPGLTKFTSKSCRRFAGRGCR